MPHLRVLCVDDNVHICAAMQLFFRRAGNHVDAAYNGLSALEMVCSSPRTYDVVITDHEMPEMDGLSLVRELRSRGHRMLIVAVSGTMDEARAMAYRIAGSDIELSKPVLPSQILSAIRRLEGRSGSSNGAEEHRDFGVE